MKKLSIRFSILIFAVAALIANSCNKEQLDQDLNQPDNAVPAAVDEAVNLANQKYLVADVFGGDEQIGFFIPNEGLIDEYLAGKESSLTPEKHPSNAFIGCLVSVGLSETQIPQVRRSLMAYQNRNETLIDKHRRELAVIIARAEAHRTELLRQLEAGEISQTEFIRKMTLLRTNLRNAIKRLKESNAADFSRSYRLLMHQLHVILTTPQWNDFTDCLQ